MPSLLQRERLPCGAAVRRFRARRARPALEASLRARQTQARQSRARRDDAPASRLHADRAARRAVHRGADVRHGLWSHQPGAHEPQLAATTAGAAARAADGHARARAGLRATRAAPGASARGLHLAACPASQLHRAAARRPDTRRLDQPQRSATPRAATRRLLLRERHAAPGILDRGRCHAIQHNGQTRSADAPVGGHGALHGPVPPMAGPVAAPHLRRGRLRAGGHPAGTPDRRRDHAGDGGLGQSRAHRGGGRVSVRGRITAARPCSLPRRQRGIALLVAILLVALGTIIAAAIAYENAMTARRGAATYAFDESLLIAQGAEALAAYGLRQVWRDDPKSTHPNQPWAKPLGPLEVVPGVMLEASLEDLSGRFNLNSLVKDDGTPDPDALAAFVHLLQWLDVEPKWAGYLIDW